MAGSSVQQGFRARGMEGGGSKVCGFTGTLRRTHCSSLTLEDLKLDGFLLEQTIGPLNMPHPRIQTHLLTLLP